MKALVTGAAGFIGARLCSALADAGHEVVGVDLLAPKPADDVRRRRAHKLRELGVCEVREVDLAADDLAPHVGDATHVFHLAAMPGVRASWGDNFEAYSRNNVLATQRVLEACSVAEPQPRVVMTSSSSIYGDQDTMPVREDATPKPRSPYGITKYAGELLARTYAMDTGIDVVVARPFTVCGPGQRPDMAGSKLIAAATGGPEFVINDRHWTRDYTHVDDVVAALIGLAEKTRLPQLAYNVAGGQRASIEEFAALVEEAVGKPPVMRDGGVGRGDPQHTWADTSAIARDIGWRPTRTLRDAVFGQVENPDGGAVRP
ncbi:MAG: NAD-dependent epimerase/dehydratase family protein [Actinomycetes bacterium]